MRFQPFSQTEVPSDYLGYLIRVSFRRAFDKHDDVPDVPIAKPVEILDEGNFVQRKRLTITR